ncbi:MAG: HEAT repeat domain-containing protein [Clostridia bacterium]|nr:HEAT repeat domain-containing protein [Clostridia bacterium]
MNCIDFDAHFADYTAQWMKEHTKDYRNYDEMEEDMPNVYMTFLNTPASWLQGVTPGAYFTQYEDAKDLVDWLNEYCDRGITVPDLLLDQIQAVGKPCEKRLVALLKDDMATEEAKMTAVGLLREMGSDLPKMLYISWQLNRNDHDDLCDNALESLEEMGRCAVQPMLEALPKANRAGQEALLDVLANYPGNEQVFQLALRLFRENPKRRALFASYLGKLGDDRALPDLMTAAKDDTVMYLDFIELRNAIEELGGTAPEREFDDDPTYDALFGTDK